MRHKTRQENDGEKTKKKIKNVWELILQVDVRISNITSIDIFVVIVIVVVAAAAAAIVVVGVVFVVDFATVTKVQKFTFTEVLLATKKLKKWK